MARSQESIKVMLLTPGDLLKLDSDQFYQLLIEASPEGILRIQALLRVAFRELRREGGK